MADCLNSTICAVLANFPTNFLCSPISKAPFLACWKGVGKRDISRRCSVPVTAVHFQLWTAAAGVVMQR